MIDELDAASPNRRESSLIQLTKFNKEIHKSLHRLRGTFPQIFKNSRPWWSSKQVINFPSIGQKSTIKCRIFSQAAPSFQPRILRSRRAQLPAEISLTEDRCFIPVGNNARYHVPGCFSFNSWGAAVTFLVVRRIPYHRHNREVQICVLKTMTTQSIPTPWKIIMAQFHIFFEVLFGFVCLIGRRDFWKTSIPAREGVDFMEGRGRFEWSLGFGQTASVEIVVYLESALNLRIVSMLLNYNGLPSKGCLDFKCFLMISARTVPLNLQPANLQKILASWWICRSCLRASVFRLNEALHFWYRHSIRSGGWCPWLKSIVSSIKLL